MLVNLCVLIEEGNFFGQGSCTGESFHAEIQVNLFVYSEIDHLKKKEVMKKSEV